MTDPDQETGWEAARHKESRTAEGTAVPNPRQGLPSRVEVLSKVLDLIPQAVFWKDSNSVYLGCNETFSRAVGLEHPDLVAGKTDFELCWPKNEAEAYRNDDLEVMRSGISKEHILEPLQQADGTRRWIDTTKVPVRDVSGQVVGVLGIFDDVTSQKAVEAELGRSTQDLNRFFSLAIDLFCIADAHGRLIRVSNAWETTLGYPVNELEGRMVLDFVHPDDRERTADVVGALASSQPVRGFVNRYLCRDGSIRWLEWRSTGFQGKLIYAAARDITESLAAQNHIREQSGFRKAIIERVAEGLCVCHDVADHPFVRFTVWNSRMAEITGYSMDEINRFGWYQSLYPDPEVQERARNRMAEMRLGNDLIGEEWEIKRKDGSKRLISISTSVVVTQDSTPHVLGLMHDLTERRRAERERQELEAQMQHVQKLESLGVLAGGIAHDFNNLLMTILGNADLALQELPGESPARPYLESVESASNRASDLCRQMLAYAGRGRFIVEPIDLNSVVRNMTRMLTVSISKKAELKCELADALPIVDGDATQLDQVLMNLVTNASDALQDRSGIITIRTGISRFGEEPAVEEFGESSLRNGECVYLEVEDTGCGMSPTVRKRIFDPFFSTKFTGRGLGLAAVLGIVRGHGGGIRVDSEPGRGTLIRILLPGSQQSAEQSEEVRVDAPEWRGNGMILIVDDEEPVRQICSEMVSRLGFDVMTARNGRDALRLYQTHRSQIRCVLLDLTMPEMDGEETYRELIRLDPEVCVILSSGYDEQDVFQRFGGDGPLGFIQKPYQIDHLRQRLQSVLT